MKVVFWAAGSLAATLSVTSCGNSGSLAGGSSGSHPYNTGPFDSRGNYVEAWADTPSKWNRAPAKPERTSSPLLAKREKQETPPVIAAVDQPPANSVPLATSSSVTTVVATRAPASRPTPPPAAKPKPQVAAKPKPKPKPSKPSPVRYTIRKGDTLYAIASRHKTSVTAIQRANGIRGSLIQPGKVLVIPRY